MFLDLNETANDRQVKVTDMFTSGNILYLSIFAVEDYLVVQCDTVSRIVFELSVCLLYDTTLVISHNYNNINNKNN